MRRFRWYVSSDWLYLITMTMKYIDIESIESIWKPLSYFFIFIQGKQTSDMHGYATCLSMELRQRAAQNSIMWWDCRYISILFLSCLSVQMYKPLQVPYGISLAQ